VVVVVRIQDQLLTESVGGDLERARPHRFEVELVSAHVLDDLLWNDRSTEFKRCEEAENRGKRFI